MKNALVLSLFALAACGEEKSTDDPVVDDPAICTTATEVRCVDEMILDLSLHDDLTSDDLVQTAVDGTDFVTTIDARAGGMNAASANPWVYVKFTDEGAVRVDIDDETALESMDWHLAAKRFMLRLNGGNSGPSCVSAVGFPSEAYGALSAAPSDTMAWTMDSFYSSECVLQEDQSGMPGSFPTAIGGWWRYESCVETTLTPYYIRLDSGKVIEAVVEAYYENAQVGCNENGAPGDNSAWYTLRWHWVEGA